MGPCPLSQEAFFHTINIFPDESAKKQRTEETSTDFSFILSTRNSPMLVYKEFVFVKNRTRSNNIVYYRCASHVCSVTAKIDSDNWLTVFGEHTHESNIKEIRMRGIRTRVIINISVSNFPQPTFQKPILS